MEALLVILAFAQRLGDPVRDVRRDLDALNDTLEESREFLLRERTRLDFRQVK